MKFEMHSLTISKDMTGAKLKQGHVITPLLRVICPPYAGSWCRLRGYRIWSLYFPPFQRYGWCPPQFKWVT